MATRADRVLAVAVGVVIIAAGVAAVAAARRGPADLDPDTPAGTVQTYLTAIVDGDLDSAAGLLAADSPCTVDDLELAYLPEGLRASLSSEQGASDTRVVVLVDITEGDTAFAEGWSHEERFVVVRDGGEWRLSGAPWPMYSCMRQE